MKTKNFSFYFRAKVFLDFLGFIDKFIYKPNYVLRVIQKFVDADLQPYMYVFGFKINY
ncbi:hypothetical protein LCGC14_1325110 [marine sediment metagenome]|uniref:Uncharacterized protein n=1 Tax=marine sediment metagenome TaxID=412755 RepID=A0A0F9KIX8_9ZZZZ